MKLIESKMHCYKVYICSRAELVSIHRNVGAFFVGGDMIILSIIGFLVIREALNQMEDL